MPIDIDHEPHDHEPHDHDNGKTWTMTAVIHQQCRRRRRRRRLLLVLAAGLVLISFSCHNNSANYFHRHHFLPLLAAAADADADDGSSSHSPNIVVADDTTLHEAKRRRSVESVIAAIRSRIRHSSSSSSNTNTSLEDEGDGASNEESHRTTRRNSHRDRRRQQQKQKQKINTDGSKIHMDESNLSSSSNTDTTITTTRNLIVGGSMAPPGRFPYAVSLQLEKLLDEASSATYGNGADLADIPTCGGTLIAMDVVLTAAHCGYEELPPSQSTTTTNTNTASTTTTATTNSETTGLNFGTTPQQVFVGADVGAYNLTDNNGGGYMVENMLFEKLVLHPDYSGFQGGGSAALQHDVMLVKLYGASDQPVVQLHNPNLGEASTDSSAAAQQQHRTPESGEELVVIGWGDTDPEFGDEHTMVASVIQVAALSYVPNDICEESKGYSVTQSYTSSEVSGYFEYDGTITDDMMCALGEYMQDACQGDSGGGLIRLGDDFTGGKKDGEKRGVWQYRYRIYSLFMILCLRFIPHTLLDVLCVSSIVMLYIQMYKWES